MDESTLVPGDRVIYIDPDQIQWGPWTVVSISEDRITVHVDDMLPYAMPRSKIRKLVNPQM